MRILIAALFAMVTLAVAPAIADDGFDALDQANAQRMARGLRPFVRDNGLTIAARVCATFRAEKGIRGHTGNDFAALPIGSTAPVAGCGHSAAGAQFSTCALYENWTYAGAAWVPGADGMYHHLFVSNTPSAGDCKDGACPTCPQPAHVHLEADFDVGAPRFPVAAAVVDRAAEFGHRVRWRITHPAGGRFRGRCCD